MFYLVYILFVVSLIGVFVSTVKSKNKAIIGFGIVYTIYSLGFLIFKYNYFYFGKLIRVEFNEFHYLLFIVLNTLILLGTYLITKINIQLQLINQNVKLIPMILIIVGLIALLKDLSYFGIYDYFFKPKSVRFHENVYKPPNLFIIHINYYLFILTGLYGLLTEAKELKKEKIIKFSIGFIAIISFLQGYRYFLAIIFLLWLVNKVYIGKLKIINLVILLFTGLFLAEFFKVLSSFFTYYQWVGEQGLFSYITTHLSFDYFLPNEIMAITTNTFLGFEMIEDLEPDIIAYFSLFFPFNDRLYDYNEMRNFYKSISMYLIVGEGQGTAFSFALENLTSYFIPLISLMFLFFIYKIHRSSMLLIIIFFVLLNLRNGFIVTISSVKILLFLYFGLLITFEIVLGNERHRKSLDS